MARVLLSRDTDLSITPGREVEMVPFIGRVVLIPLPPKVRLLVLLPLERLVLEPPKDRVLPLPPKLRLLLVVPLLLPKREPLPKVRPEEFWLLKRVPLPNERSPLP